VSYFWQDDRERLLMAFTRSVPESEATGAVAEMYEADRATAGELLNFTKAFSLRPEVFAAWRELSGAIKANMDPRRYELATIAAARRLRSSYCMLAHGSVLMTNFMEPDALRAVVEDYVAADLEPVDLAVMKLPDKVALDATAVEENDVDELRELGLTDGEIVDVVLAAAARCFFSKTLDGLGVEPDARYSALEPTLRDALTVGRPIATGG
jgi:uncharacterized peroxidase-related enzyme